MRGRGAPPSPGEVGPIGTAIGRSILKRMRDWLQNQGGRIIELDTDGAYFTLPPGVSRQDCALGLRNQLPSGIRVDFDKRFAVMFSYTKKNAAF